MTPDLQETLVPLTEKAHIDAAWLWPGTETVDVVRHTFGTASQLMDEYPPATHTRNRRQPSEMNIDIIPPIRF
jgi:alpha-mannosidase